MNSDKSIIVVSGEPNSVFLEIFFKTVKKLNTKKPLILIASYKLVKLQMAKLKFKKRIKIINQKNLINSKFDNKCINLIDVKYNPSQAFEKISSKSNNYIERCFDVAFQIIKKTILKDWLLALYQKKHF
tara:strand:+ start:71 stop:457 length:387 start_codon:yes stop_codon:yes gene_type:complete